MTYRPADEVAGHVDDAAQTQARLTQTLKSAMNVLWAFTLENPSWGVNELGRHLGLHKSTVSRLLATLEERRLVQKDPRTERYRLGLGILELAGVALDQLDLRQAAAPSLRQLAAATKETISLAVWDDGEVVLIEHMPSTEPVKYLGWIGHRSPAYCSSGGKAILAFSDAALVDSIVERGLVQYTASTLTTGQSLRRDLEETRKRGYSINRGEYRDSLAAVAAPLWDNAGNIVGAVAVAGPSYRFTSEHLEHAGEMAKETAAEISRQLGARAYPPRHLAG